MAHTHFQELISLHVDNELSDTESAELFAHLATCDACRKFLRTTMSIRSQIANEELAEVPESLDRRVLGVRQPIPDLKVSREWLAPLWWTRISIPLPAAASLAFLILFCTLLISPIIFSQKATQETSTETTSRVPLEIQKQLQLYR
jgi:anti-sigma factor RsiW